MAQPMPTHVFEGLSELALNPAGENTRLCFRLTFQPSSSPEEPQLVQFELSSADAMEFLGALRDVQRRLGWPSRRPPRGRPALKIVEPSDGA